MYYINGSSSSAACYDVSRGGRVVIRDLYDPLACSKTTDFLIAWSQNKFP